MATADRHFIHTKLLKSTISLSDDSSDSIRAILEYFFSGQDMNDINFSNLNVLIVDDLGSVRKVLKKILTELGAKQVLEAADGEDAYKKISDGGCDLVISDWEMPKLNGVDLVKKLRSEERTQKLPFIMITAHGTKESVIAAVQAGVSNFIVKPFSAGILKNKISEALSTSFNLQNVLAKLPTSKES